jgi:predicted ATP-dependent endonuclease of OLD family
MRIKEVKISGFKPIPFCADYQPDNDHRIVWDQDAFSVKMPIESPLLSAVIGPNSSGKSSILYALSYFFSSTTKLKPEMYNGEQTEKDIVVEIAFVGEIADKNEWHDENCNDADNGKYELTLASAWLFDKPRIHLIKRSDGSYRKATPNDKKNYKELLPEFRIISADAKMSDEANPEKKNLVADLIEEVLKRGESRSNRSIQYKINKHISALNKLLRRETPPNKTAWQDIEELEALLSGAIGPMTPGEPRAKLSFQNSMPSIQQVFMSSRILVDDGIELNLDQHGLGLQRAFVVSALSAWNQWIGHKDDTQDYVIGIEEPELYLHPHAIRVLMKTFQEIAKQDQVIFTSHSSEFVNHVPLENVTCVRRKGNNRSIVQPNLENLSDSEKTKVQRYLIEDRSDMLFARSVILVEGQSELFALPNMAKTLGYDLDKKGVSIVSTGGKGNFETYHTILNAFDVPHVLLADGDGGKMAKEQEYQDLAQQVYVLEDDFETQVASIIPSERLLEIVNECRSRVEKPPLASIGENDITADQLLADWWRKLKNEIHADIISEHRELYDERKNEIKGRLQIIAESVVQDNHMLPSLLIRKRAKQLKKVGKPLAGRVLGEFLTKKELENMGLIVDAIKTASLMSENH